MRGAAVLVVLLGTAACGDAPGDAEASPAGAAATSVSPAGELVRPPAVNVTTERGVVDLEPWAWCWRATCVDADRPLKLVVAGAPDELVLAFPEPDWNFTATFRPSGESCARSQTVPLAPLGDNEHRLRPAGLAGTYDVSLTGRGPEGDVTVSARWTTTANGPMPVPRAWLAVLADHDGVVDSYGLEFNLDDLAATPERAEATITVTSAEGRSATFAVTPSGGECQEDGRLRFDGPAEAGEQAVALGSAPFTYDVDLVLDGHRHTASATWPADVVEDLSPAVALQFEPPLPALTP